MRQINKMQSQEMEDEHKKYRISTWAGFSGCKCPRCRVGNVFVGRTYSLKPQKMIEYCSHCNLRYEREPGYFYVAMYVSYALSIAEIVTVCTASYILGLDMDHKNLYAYMGIVILTSVLLAPFNYRYSRMILLYWLSPGLGYEQWRSKPKTPKKDHPSTV